MTPIRSRFPLPAMPPLALKDVHLWFVPRRTSDTGVVHEYMNLLSQDEKDRAARYHFDEDRFNFIRFRGILRLFLGFYAGYPPELLKFGYTEKGKPYLKSQGARGPIHFNLSHSEGAALFGFSMAGPIGVDVEQLRPIADALDIAGHYFSHRQKMELESAPSSEKDRLFFEYWTRMEAWLKACGEGLSEDGRGDEGIIQTLSLQPGYIASIAVNSMEIRVSSFQWAEPQPDKAGPSS